MTTPRCKKLTSVLWLNLVATDRNRSMTVESFVKSPKGSLFTFHFLALSFAETTAMRPNFGLSPELRLTNFNQWQLTSCLPRLLTYKKSDFRLAELYPSCACKINRWIQVNFGLQTSDWAIMESKRKKMTSLFGRFFVSDLGLSKSQCKTSQNVKWPSVLALVAVFHVALKHKRRPASTD